MLTALIGPVTSLLDKFIEDKDQKNKLAHEIATMADKQAHEIAKSQIDVNKAEAQSRHWWIAGRVVPARQSLESGSGGAW